MHAYTVPDQNRTVYPQFDPERETTPAEDLLDGSVEAAEAFVAWMAEPDQYFELYDLLINHQKNRIVEPLINQWSAATNRQT